MERTTNTRRDDTARMNRAQTAGQAPRRRTHPRRTPMQKMLDRAMPYIIMLGLPAFGLLLGVIITGSVMRHNSRYMVRDYGRELVYATYTVQSGDTMWSIAEDMAALNPEFPDMRQYLTLLQRTNKNYGDVLLSGTTILIPYYQGSRGRSVLEIYEKYGLYQEEPETRTGSGAADSDR